MAADTPPGAMPTIRPGMRINLTLESLLALIGGVVFCTVFYIKVDRLEANMAVVMRALGLSDVQGPPAPTSGNPHAKGSNP